MWTSQSRRNKPSTAKYEHRYSDIKRFHVRWLELHYINPASLVRDGKNHRSADTHISTLCPERLLKNASFVKYRHRSHKRECFFVHGRDQEN